MRQNISWVEMEEVINHQFICAKDIIKLIPGVNYNAALKIVSNVVDKMKENNEFVHKSRPLYVPTEKVLQLFNLDSNNIRRQAEKQRKGLKVSYE